MLLSPILHPDVISLVLSYEATIQFKLQRSYGGRHGKGDGEMRSPRAISLHEEEFIVVDHDNSRIQVFHQASGRFLRKWGHYGAEEGEFQYPRVAGIAQTRTPDQELEAEIFVGDFHSISVFRFWDCKFLRRFRITDTEDASLPCGISVGSDFLFVSRSWPAQIDVMKKSDGKRVRCIGDRWGLDSSPGKIFAPQPEKELWWADPPQNRVLVIDTASGQILREYGAQASAFHPEAVVVHGEDVIVCDPDGDRLVVFDQHSHRMVRTISTQRSYTGRSSTQGCRPNDVAINGHNQLFVCDSLNHRVLLFE